MRVSLPGLLVLTLTACSPGSIDLGPAPGAGGSSAGSAGGGAGSGGVSTTGGAGAAGRATGTGGGTAGGAVGGTSGGAAGGSVEPGGSGGPAGGSAGGAAGGSAGGTAGGEAGGAAGGSAGGAAGAAAGAGGSVEPPGPTGDFTIAAALDSPSSALAETHQVQITIAPMGGFEGTVTLSPGTLPAGFTLTFDQPTIAVTATGAMATGRLVVPAAAQAGTATLGIHAESGALAHDATAQLTVRAEFTIRIARGVATNNNPDAFGANPLRIPMLQAGTKITWVNEDSVSHRIHGDGVNGFDHEGGNLAAGAKYSVTITAPGTYDYRCHIHEGMQGTVIVSR